MGYFSNGTEGLDYEHRYCRRCVHRGTETEGCPVFGAHFVFNYDQLKEGSEQLKNVLEMLIPRTETGNGECRMFHLDSEPSIDPSPDAPLNLYVGRVETQPPL